MCNRCPYCGIETLRSDWNCCRDFEATATREEIERLQALELERCEQEMRKAREERENNGM